MIECEFFTRPTITEKRYDPKLGVGSPTWDEEITVNQVHGRVRAVPELSSSAGNDPERDTYTLDENFARMQGFLVDRLNLLNPTKPEDLNWTEVPPWQAAHV